MPATSQITLAGGNTPTSRLTLDKTYEHAVVDGSAWTGVVTLDIQELQAMQIHVTGILQSGLTLAPPANMPRGSTILLRLAAPGDQIWGLDAAYDVFGVPELWVAGKAVLYQITRMPVDNDPGNDLYAINGTVEGHEFGQGIYSNFPGVTGVEAIVGYWGADPIYRQYFTGSVSEQLHVIGGAVTRRAFWTVNIRGSLRYGAGSQKFMCPSIHFDPRFSIGFQYLETSDVWRFVLASDTPFIGQTYHLWADYNKRD